MSECPRVGKFFGGCRFEPRYDEPILSEMQRMTGSSSWHKVEGTNNVTWQDDPLGERRYVQDVCVRCGKIAQRTPNTPANGEVE